MPNGWKITIHGGFAWVFEGDKGNEGIASRVTVGPYRKPNGHPRYHPHRMVLWVPESSLNRVRTTMPYQSSGGGYLFELRDDVTLNEAATGPIRRTISSTRPTGSDDFYWVYDADRFRDRTGQKRTPLGTNWQGKLLGQLALQGGTLKVLPSPFVYEISDGTDGFEQPLATHIEYHPSWSASEVEFRTKHGLVVAAPANFDISADCGCSDDPPIGPIAGFDLTFDLYQDPKAPPRFEPRYKGYTPPAKANAPGPDCPPRSYSI